MTSPVIVRHGERDMLSDPDFLLDYAGDRVTEKRISADAGSLILLEHWPEVLDRLAQGVAQGVAEGVAQGAVKDVVKSAANP